MPVHVQIYVNDREVSTIHIGREENLRGPDEEHSYIVTRKEYDQTFYEGKPRSFRPDWTYGEQFTHRYSDGLEVCVRKALERLEQADE